MLQPTILIVDDEKAYCEVLREVLEVQGYHVELAYDAGDALFRLRERKPDLILMDVMMPEIDGLSLMGRLRLNDDWARIPIVVVSAKASSIDRDVALASGANGFLAKPFTVEMLRAALAEHLPVRPRAA